MDKIELLKDLRHKMENSLKVLDNELKGLRTGRASVNLLDPVMVDAYGSKMPISQVGTVSTPDSRTVTVQVWDKTMVKAAEKAIADANLGVNPATDGQLIRLPMPQLSEDRRKELAKLASKYGENTKIATRNIRRDGMEVIKKMEKESDISEDEMHKISDEVQKLTDEYAKKIDEKVTHKEQEILKI